MAHGAIVNAMWDLRARREGKPLWRLLAELSPEELVDLVDFRYLARRAHPRARRCEILRARRAGPRASAQQRCSRTGYPAYTTTPGLARLRRREARPALAARRSPTASRRSSSRSAPTSRTTAAGCALAREAVGPDVRIAIDANQVWGVERGDRVGAARCATFDPYWIEEPTAPDDVLGHAAIRAAVAPVRSPPASTATTRCCSSSCCRPGAIDVVQIDASRVAGVNENIAILLLAAKFGVPVCPHAGGVGLCEMVQHLAMFDYVAVSGSWEDRVIEYVDHLHEHFVDPVEIRDGRYVAPTAPGAGARMHRRVASPRTGFPDGRRQWQRRRQDGSARQPRADDRVAPATSTADERP